MFAGNGRKLCSGFLMSLYRIIWKCDTKVHCFRWKLLYPKGALHADSRQIAPYGGGGSANQ